MQVHRGEKGGLTSGLVFAPRLTRLAATVFTATAVSDFLQAAYSLSKEAAEGEPALAGPESRPAVDRVA